MTKVLVVARTSPTPKTDRRVNQTVASWRMASAAQGLQATPPTGDILASKQSPKQTTLFAKKHLCQNIYLQQADSSHSCPEEVTPRDGPHSPTHLHLRAPQECHPGVRMLLLSAKKKRLFSKVFISILNFSDGSDKEKEERK